jgi:hypothetical protein
MPITPSITGRKLSVANSDLYSHEHYWYSTTLLLVPYWLRIFPESRYVAKPEEIIFTLIYSILLYWDKLNDRVSRVNEDNRPPILHGTSFQENKAKVYKHVI